jgi:type II secretory pathway pseudopilin PulG
MKPSIQKKFTNQRGAAMLGIVLIIVVILIALVGALSIGPQLQKITTERQTVKRANVIVDAVRQYYLARGELPEPSSVPVVDLNLEQQYKLDSWGQEWEYDAASSITGITVNGQNVAGVLISGGPDQDRGTRIDDTATQWVLTTTGTETEAEDDIIIPINVQGEAIQIARDEMGVLSHKLWAHACAHPASAMPGIDYFGLGETYANDPWLNSYILSSTGVISFGPDRIQNTSDDIFLSALIKDCPDDLPPLTTPIAKADFEDIGEDEKVSFGTDEGTWVSDNNSNLSDSTSTDTPNRSDSSLALDGDEYITIDGSDDSNSKYNFSLNQPFTLSMWVKFRDDGSGWVDLISKYENTSEQTGYQLIRHNSSSFQNRIYFFLTSDITQSEQIRVHGETNLMDTDNKDFWHLVTVTYDAKCNEDGEVTDDNVKIYIDGFENNTQPQNPGTPKLDCQNDSISNSVPLRISGRADDQGNLNALIDDVAIYDKALDANEVEYLYYLSSVVRYEFKGGLRDFSRSKRGGQFMYNTNPATTNLPTYVADRFGNQDSALDFNDNGVYVQNEGADDFLNGLSKVTLECWIKSDIINTDNGFILGRYPPNGQDRWFGLRYDASGTLTSNNNLIKGGINTNSSPTFQAIETSSNQQKVKWQQVVMTWKSGKNTQIYIDGDIDLNSTVNHATTGYIDQINNFLIGKGAKDVAANAGWDGIIDDVTIYPRVLSPAEIKKSWDNYDKP